MLPRCSSALLLLGSLSGLVLHVAGFGDGSSLCDGTLESSLPCDAGFSSSVSPPDGASGGLFGSITSSGDLTAGQLSQFPSHAAITLLKWKCVCTTCTSAASCTKCTRGTDSNVVQYYNFRAAHCDSNTLATSVQQETTSAIEHLFLEHSQERTADIALLPWQVQEKDEELGSTSSIKMGGCHTDLSTCMDYSMPASCEFVSSWQLETLATSDGTYTSFGDFMQERLELYIPTGRTCSVNGMRHKMSWSSFVQGPDERFHLAYGVPSKLSYLETFNVKPDEALNAAYPGIQFADTALDCRTNGRKCRAKAAMQVSICADKTVNGISSTKQLTESLKDGVGCGGQLTFGVVDAIFREAVAYARFQLAKARQGTSSSYCNADTWSGLDCINSMFSDSSDHCHMVKLTQLVVSGDNTNTGYRVYANGEFDPKPEVFQMCVDNAGAMTQGDPRGTTDENGLSTGQSAATKCSIKVCGSSLQMRFEGRVKVSLESENAADTLQLTDVELYSATSDTQIFTMDIPWDKVQTGGSLTPD